MRVQTDRAFLPNFNPHSREGSDSDGYRHSVVCRNISIHTPARGVTGADPQILYDVSDFNPHSREGSDVHHRLFVRH